MKKSTKKTLRKKILTLAITGLLFPSLSIASLSSSQSSFIKKNDLGANIQSLSYRGEVSFRIKASDIFRMKKIITEVSLFNTLKPLIGKTFYSKESFLTAIKVLMEPNIVEKHKALLLDKAKQNSRNLSIDVLTDDILHIGYLKDMGQKSNSTLLSSTELINIKKFDGAKIFQQQNSDFITGALKVKVDQSSLCVYISSTKQGALTTICPKEENSFTLDQKGEHILNGLGQEFHAPGSLNSNWNGFKRQGGNKMEAYMGGATGNTQFPILYVTNKKAQNYALYLDTIYDANWDFTKLPWTISTAQGTPNFLFMAGDNLPDLRSKYMNLVGNPLVPPRKMFGLWISEYGFDNWNELDDKLKTLRENKFPIDGVVMDLQWFGNIKNNSSNSQMGTLDWDLQNFPDSKLKINSLKKDGIGMILIEESYISDGLIEHKKLEEKGYLVIDPKTTKAINTDQNGSGAWWGKGGMMDWTNTSGAAYWHDLKRNPLIEMGVIGFWTDLGEPEISNPNGVYFNNKSHNDVHNIYNYKWLESIYAGYQRNNTKARSFMLSRSGAPGIQRFGAAMWSGDIGTNLESLSSHMSMQPNMMLSGIDYYGSDVGGFHRSALKAAPKDRLKVLNETYTKWFAYSSMFDIPLRPHTENLCNCKETAPDRIGSLASNRASIDLKYQLIPYIYSLAHRANLFAEPLFPPMEYYFDKDPKACNLPAQKMLGKDLIAAAASKIGQSKIDLYLPKGNWYNFRTAELFTSKGELFKDLELYDNGVLQLPIYARAGAIIAINPEKEIPLTSNVPLTLAVKIFEAEGSFTVFEDDGVTDAYLEGNLRKTALTTKTLIDGVLLTIQAKGDYKDAPIKRPIDISWYGIGKVNFVLLNGKMISGWKQAAGVFTLNTEALNVKEKTVLKLIIKK